MKKYILALIAHWSHCSIFQMLKTTTTVVPDPFDTRVITTGIPFLLIAS